MSRIEFIEETHQYMLDGVSVPSVSSIIKDENMYANIPPHILEKASHRGTQVHYYTELVDLDKKVKFEEEFAPYLVQYLLFLRKENPIWTDVETIVHTEEYAGTLDRIGVEGDFIIVADIKTTSRLYKDSLGLQLGAYIIAHSEMTGNPLSKYKGRVVWLKKDRWAYKEIEPDFEGFRKKLKEYKEKHNVKKVDLEELFR